MIACNRTSPAPTPVNAQTAKINKWYIKSGRIGVWAADVWNPIVRRDIVNVFSKVWLIDFYRVLLLIRVKLVIFKNKW